MISQIDHNEDIMFSLESDLSVDVKNMIQNIEGNVSQEAIKVQPDKSDELANPLNLQGQLLVSS